MSELGPLILAGNIVTTLWLDYLLKPRFARLVPRIAAIASIQAAITVPVVVLVMLVTGGAS